MIGKTATRRRRSPATGVAPASPRESAIVVTLQPGSYTAVVRGWEHTEGIALVEAYVLDSGTAAAGESLNARPNRRGRRGIDRRPDCHRQRGQACHHPRARTFSWQVVGGTLADPMLEVRDGAGNLVGENNNWGDGPSANEIIASGVPPGNGLESAIVATLAPGSYTAVVRGVNGGTGVGLVEVYDLDESSPSHCRFFAQIG